MTPTRRALVSAVLYLIVAIALAGIRPLWLDEILQLLDTRQPSVSRLIEHLPHHTGSVPLGYLVQQTSLKITGYSPRRARLPEAVFGAAAVLVVALLAAELGLQLGWMAALVYGALPLILRYATEGRMYSQALFFSMLATLLYMRLARRPTLGRAGAYYLALLAAVYTQPYSVFVAGAHLLWSWLGRERKAALLGAAAFAVTLAAFLPWYLWAKPQWNLNINEGAQHFSASVRTPLMIFRELAGASYAGTAVLLILCAAALIERTLTPRSRSLLVLLFLVPLAASFAADASFDYFIAARQFIWALPAAAILASAAIEQRKRTTLVFAGLFGVICTWQSFRFFTAPHEDWQAAATAIAEQARCGACIVIAPAEQASLYEFFHPELKHARFSGPRVVLAITPYSTSDERRAAIVDLVTSGYEHECGFRIGESRIEMFRKGW